MITRPTATLFEEPAQAARREAIATDAVLLRGYATAAAPALLAALEDIFRAAPPRRFVTPGGKPMSVLNTSCGAYGWVSDRRGYRYVAEDPESGRPWPAMPPSFSALAGSASRAAGFGAFTPDACLINVYTADTRLSLHQDHDELDFTAPIVSVSLGLPAKFVFGGATRTAATQQVPLLHGDVVVWGRSARLAFHGIARLPAGTHPLTGGRRINLTFRKAR